MEPIPGSTIHPDRFVPWDPLGTLDNDALSGGVVFGDFSDALIAGAYETATALYFEGSLQRALHYVLQGAIETTEADYGFVGVCEGDSLRVYAWSGLQWDPTDTSGLIAETDRSYSRDGYVDFGQDDNLFMRVVREARPIVENDRVAHGGRTLPSGHPPLTSFIGMPYVVDGQSLAMIGVARSRGAFAIGADQIVERWTRIVGLIYRLRARQFELAAAYREKLELGRVDTVSNVVAEIAHDINNEFFTIRATAAALQARALGDAEEDIANLNAAVTEASEIVSSFVQKARGTRDASDFNDLVVEIAERKSRLDLIVGSATPVMLDLASEPLPVALSRADIRRILLNTCWNAREASPEANARVTITVRRATADDLNGLSGIQGDHPYALLAICDRGSGMDADTLARATKRFFTTKDVGGSNGLGLASVARVVATAQGKLDIRSAVGVGTCVRIVLPLVGAAPTTVPVQRSARAAKPADQALSLLVVDDGKATARIIQAMCEAAGHRVEIFTRADEALVWANRAGVPIDVLVTDIRMEPFDGYQLADQIKKAHPDIGVVFMSGYFPDTNIPPHPDGAALVRKPFDDVSLLQKIAEVAK